MKRLFALLISMVTVVAFQAHAALFTGPTGTNITYQTNVIIDATGVTNIFNGAEVTIGFSNTMFGPFTPGTTSAGWQEAYNALTRAADIYHTGGGTIIPSPGAYFGTSPMISNFLANPFHLTIRGSGMGSCAYVYEGTNNVNVIDLTGTNSTVGFDMESMGVFSKRDSTNWLVRLNNTGRVRIIGNWFGGYHGVTNNGGFGFQIPTGGSIVNVTNLGGIRIGSRGEMNTISENEFSNLKNGMFFDADHMMTVGNSFANFRQDPIVVSDWPTNSLERIGAAYIIDHVGRWMSIMDHFFEQHICYLDASGSSVSLKRVFGAEMEAPNYFYVAVADHTPGGIHFTDVNPQEGIFPADNAVFDIIGTTYQDTGEIPGNCYYTGTTNVITPSGLGFFTYGGLGLSIDTSNGVVRPHAAVFDTYVATTNTTENPLVVTVGDPGLLGDYPQIHTNAGTSISFYQQTGSTNIIEREDLGSGSSTWRILSDTNASFVWNGPETKSGFPASNIAADGASANATIDTFRFASFMASQDRVIANLFTNTGTAYVPTNTAPRFIFTNDFVSGQIYTNVNQRAVVKNKVVVTLDSGQARHTLAIDQNHDGTFEDQYTDIHIITQAASLGASMSFGLTLEGHIEPNAIFTFTNSTIAGDAVVTGQVGASRWILE